MMDFKALLASSDNPNSLGNKFRKQRFQYFENLIEKNFEKNFPVRILDIGGMEHFWKDQALLHSGKVEVVMLNLSAEKVQIKGLSSMAGNATDLSQFANGSFDLVFSNSVIEHLYTWENQQKMAKEAIRVGKKYFVQTPNRHFFMEAHYALPFVQYLPKNLTYFLLTNTKLSRGSKWDPKDAQQYLDEIRLLSEREMKMLFPAATMYKEKFMGMVKSYSAHNMS
ncbi:class I SAM-dependent methyltransferase [Aquiflexum gelatinilyticum]|uniref:Class I SAM-dependent methyltransferase n=1 Tax=Aquiflexum gelatinilyticum TaxID=2961943 RepID=A0A9X2SZB4_9BACT|nr:class I SAM-dependent methyltransferase [Aquiflexum gelatinilyticum]MCR9016234.1 class I SAM-dependent methyltransferase [Aquiflexum gelatinilyticum]MCS4435673.1 class I SAM-dependent methyltransferase [Aquiflexum gelatinilyticum]